MDFVFLDCELLEIGDTLFTFVCSGLAERQAHLLFGDSEKTEVAGNTGKMAAGRVGLGLTEWLTGCTMSSDIFWRPLRIVHLQSHLFCLLIWRLLPPCRGTEAA